MKKKRKKLTPSRRSERIVVDEVFDNGLARILRAQKGNHKPTDYGIDAWEKEQEDFINDWRIEAFAGFSGGRKLREGDVFFIADGSLLNNKYDPIPRAAARKKHLLMPADKSIKLARLTIKEEFRKLLAYQISADEKRDADDMIQQVKVNMKIERSSRR